MEMYYLTTNEIRVIQGLVKGLSTSEIASELGINLSAVNYVRGKIKTKLDYKSNTGLLMKALQLGFFNEYLNCAPLSKYRFCKHQILTLAEGLYLNLVLTELSKREIANEMDCSRHRITQFQQRLYEKWGVESINDLILKAIHKGYIRLVPNGTQQEVSNDRKLALWNALRHYRFKDDGCLYPILYNWEFKHSIVSETSLNYKEHNQLRMHLMGKSETEISAELDIEIRTVNRYKSRIKKKLNAKTTGDLIKSAINAGILRILPESSITELSGMEVDIIKQIAASRSVKTISEMLNIPPRTLSEQIDQMKRSWFVNSDEGLIVQALRKNSITLETIR